MLEAVDLTKKYGSNVALDRLNLTIAPGEVFCVLGANGAGKTTTIDLFLNFIDPSAATARINGLDVTKQPLETKRFVAYISEQMMLYRSLTGLENLEYFSALAGHKYPRSAFIQLVRDVGLPEGAEGQRVSTYSKGMRQKIGVAIAIAKKAESLPLGILNVVRTVSVMLLVVLMATLPAFDFIYCPDGCADEGRARSIWQSDVSTAPDGACGLCLNGLAVAPPSSPFIAIQRVRSTITSAATKTRPPLLRVIDQPPRP